MPRPPLTSTDPDKPYNSHESLRNQVGIMRWFGIRGWMMEATFDEVVSMWWHVQEIKATELERIRLQRQRINAYARLREGGTEP